MQPLATNSRWIFLGSAVLVLGVALLPDAGPSHSEATASPPRSLPLRTGTPKPLPVPLRTAPLVRPVVPRTNGQLGYGQPGGLQLPQGYGSVLGGYAPLQGNGTYNGVPKGGFGFGLGTPQALRPPAALPPFFAKIPGFQVLPLSRDASDPWSFDRLLVRRDGTIRYELFGTDATLITALDPTSPLIDLPCSWTYKPSQGVLRVTIPYPQPHEVTVLVGPGRAGRADSLILVPGGHTWRTAGW